ncbi:hypothetical protein BC629DRAFT_398425 [Irpex lacteus]|nr:hypothetical protein BC629DRAFT_398425 [Irpex lacteus]
MDETDEVFPYGCLPRYSSPDPATPLVDSRYRSLKHRFWGLLMGKRLGPPALSAEKIRCERKMLNPENGRLLHRLVERGIAGFESILYRLSPEWGAAGKSKPWKNVLSTRATRVCTDKAIHHP